MDFKTTPDQRKNLKLLFVKDDGLIKVNGMDYEAYAAHFAPALVDDLNTAIATIKKLAPYKDDVDGLERKIISLEQERNSLQAQLAEAGKQVERMAGKIADYRRLHHGL